MVRRSLRSLFLVALSLVAACGGTPAVSESPGDATGSPDASGPVDVDVLRYTCGLFPFGPELLVAPVRNDEDAANPIAAALRQHLAQGGPDIDFLPDHGWTFVGENGQSAEFVTIGRDLEMSSVNLSNEGGWKVSGWGGCRPRIVLAQGLGPAIWEWGSEGVPNPETTAFDALVTEMECASGQSSEGRVVGPQIVPTETQVLVIFAVRSLGGGTCPSNPSTRVPVTLGEPLGDRELLDAGELPFRDPTQPRF